MPDEFRCEFTEAELCGQIEDVEQTLEAKTIKIRSRHLYRRLMGERRIEDVLPLEVAPGDCFHVISGGDVDSFSFLMWILRMQKVRRLLCSTWCIAAVDVQEFHRQIVLGRIGRLGQWRRFRFWERLGWFWFGFGWFWFRRFRRICFGRW